MSVSGTASELLSVIVYGTSWLRVTFSSADVFDIATASSSSGSTGMWLLKIWLVYGSVLLPSVNCR
jgi:hypothetical protein